MRLEFVKTIILSNIKLRIIDIKISLNRKDRYLLHSEL